jgi:hypothetical protein
MVIVRQRYIWPFKPYGALVVGMERHKGQIQRASRQIMRFLSEFWADEQVGSVPDVTDVYLNWVRSCPPNNPVQERSQKPRGGNVCSYGVAVAHTQGR